MVYDLKKIKSLQICQMTHEMLKEVSRIHIHAFKGAMNTRLGELYVRRFFDWFIHIENGIALVAILKNGAREEIVGYAIGVPPGLGKSIDRDLFWIVCWSVCLRPWLILSRQFQMTIMARLKAILNPFPIQNLLPINLPDPVMSLVGLAVEPGHQGQNIGEELLCIFEDRARGFHSRSLKLSVYPENCAARRVYEKCGWIPCEVAEESPKAMFYYKIL